jgi:hypothetical protein
VRLLRLSGITAICLFSICGTAQSAASASRLPKVSALRDWKLAVADAAHQGSLHSTIRYSSSLATINWATDALPNEGYQTYTGTQGGQLGHFAVQLGPRGDAYFSGDPWGLHDRLLVTAIPAGVGANQWYWVAPGKSEYVNSVANGLSVRQIATDLATALPGNRLSASYDGTWTKHGKKVDVIYLHNLEMSPTGWSTAYVTEGSHPLPLEVDSDEGVETFSWGVPVQVPALPQSALPSSSLQFGNP